VGGFVDIARDFSFGMIGVREVLGSFARFRASGVGRSSVRWFGGVVGLRGGIMISVSYGCFGGASWCA